MNITTTSTNRNLSNTTISIRSTIHLRYFYYYYYCDYYYYCYYYDYDDDDDDDDDYYYYFYYYYYHRGFRASAFCAGSAPYARLRFPRVPRVLFCAGSARVVALKFPKEIKFYNEYYYYFY